MNKIQKRALTLLVTITFAASTLSLHYTPAAFAAQTSAHVRIVGSDRTVWYGDVTTDGCTISDTENTQHTYTQPIAVCALDAASKTGGFTYAVKDFGGSLGLFLQSIASDTGASDFSTYWSYDLNGKSASQGISNQVIANGDSLYFHFEDPTVDVNKRSLNDGITYLRSQQQNTGEISGFSGVSGWAAMSFAAAGIDLATVKHGSPSLLDYLSANPPTANASATEWERGILAITATGTDPYNFGGTNYVQKLETYHNNNQLGSTTQVNDDIFGLLALVAAGSGASSQIKQDALNFILAHQHVDGGFSWSTTGESDVDDTASAIQALVAAQKAGMSASNLAAAITNAQNYILAAKNTDGGFASTKGDASNTSTTSWVVMALNALGVTGSDMTNADAYMRSNQEENGSFKWQSSSTGDTFTSSYAVLAITGKYWPVKIFVGETPTLTPSPTVTLTPSPTPITLEPTVSPTTIPSITPTVSQEPTPTIIPRPNPNDRLREMIRREHERMLRIREQLQKFCERIQAQFHREMVKLSRHK